MPRMKGLELPVNMIIVIAIAVLVLVVIAAFFAGQTGQGFSTIGDTAALGQGCQIWLQSSCTGSASTVQIYNYFITPTAGGAKQQGYLSDACTRTGNGGPDPITNKDKCAVRCGCPNA